MKLFHLKLRLHRATHDIKSMPRKHKFTGLIVLLLMISAVYGLSLRSRAENGRTNISAPTDIYYLGNYDTTDALGWRTKALPAGFTPTFVGTCNSADSNYGGEIYLVDEVNGVIKGMANANSNFINNSLIDISPPPGEQIYKSTCNGDNLIALTNTGKVYYLPNFSTTWTLINKNNTLTNYNLFTDMGVAMTDVVDFYIGFQTNTGQVHYHLLSATKALDFYAGTTVAVYDITGIPAGEVPQQTTTLFADYIGAHYRYIMTDKGKLYLSPINTANMSFVADYKTPSSYNVYSPGSDTTNSEFVKHFSVQIPAPGYQSLFSQSNKITGAVYMNYFRKQDVVNAVPDTSPVGTVYSFAGCKPINVWTRSWAGNSANNRYTTIFGSGCADPTKPDVVTDGSTFCGTGTTWNGTSCVGTGGTTTTTTTMNYDGVSIHTKIENITGTVATNPLFGTATVKRGQVPAQVAKFTLTVNNGGAEKVTDIKFTLPAGFTFNQVADVYGDTPAPTSYDPATRLITWSSFTAPVGQTELHFNATMP